MTKSSIQYQGNELVIRLNREDFSASYLLSLIRRLQLEELAQQAGFNEKVLEIAEEIDQQWWDEHREEFLNI
jgi:hypothetical protein